jgi:Phage stabilisation protein
MKTPFLGGAYASRSLPLSAQTCINLYPEENESKAGDVGAFYGTPGLVLRSSMTPGEGRALKSWDGSILYAVVGANVYGISPSWNATLIGQLTSSNGTVSTVANNQAQIVFAHSGGWHYTTGSTLTFIPAGPANSIVTYMDGYVLFTDGRDQFGITALNDVTSIDPLDVATAEAWPDDLISLYADQRETWMFGSETTEIWADTGAALFPFERIPGGVLSTGCAAKFSPAYQDGSIFWLARDRTGDATVVRTIGYQIDRVSTHAIEHAFESYSTIEDAIGFAYQTEGHSFYGLTFPTADVTWVYDAATKLWHQRCWQDSNGVLHRHRIGAYAFFNGNHVILDHSNGNLYTFDLNTTTDNGTPIYRERAWPLVAPQEMKRLRCDHLELVGEMGVGAVTGTDTLPQVWLQMSYDGGRSFGFERYRDMGAIGRREVRARWRRNGLGRRPVARLATVSTRKVAWLGVNVDGELMSQ